MAAPADKQKQNKTNLWEIGSEFGPGVAFANSSWDLSPFPESFPFPSPTAAVKRGREINLVAFCRTAFGAAQKLMQYTTTVLIIIIIEAREVWLSFALEMTEGSFFQL